jgi:hypothetical protein
LTTDKPREKGIQTDPRMPMTSNELIASLREMKKTNPAEYAVFQKDYAEEMTEGVSFWSANCGYITLWKLQEGVEVSGCELEGASRLGDEWGCLSGISTRTITKKMVEREDFYEEDESDDEEEVGLSSCPKCETTYTQKQIDDGEVVPCNRCYKCFVGECGKDNCDCEPVKEGCDCGCGCGAPCSVDDPKTVRQENEKDKEETKKAMKDYVKARMNYLMRKARNEFSDYELASVATVFTRRDEWDEMEFDTYLCSLSATKEKDLNTYKSSFDFGVSATKKKNDKEWRVVVEWSKDDTNPFDDFYDEDEDENESDDDE